VPHPYDTNWDSLRNGYGSGWLPRKSLNNLVRQHPLTITSRNHVVAEPAQIVWQRRARHSGAPVNGHVERVSTPTGKTRIGDGGSWRGISDGRSESLAGIYAPLLGPPKNVRTIRIWTELILRLEIGARTKTQFNGVGRLRTYISFTHSA
jgi:hypothetical protein